MAQTIAIGRGAIEVDETTVGRKRGRELRCFGRDDARCEQPGALLGRGGRLEQDGGYSRTTAEHARARSEDQHRRVFAVSHRTVSPVKDARVARSWRLAIRAPHSGIRSSFRVDGSLASGQERVVGQKRANGSIERGRVHFARVHVPAAYLDELLGYGCGLVEPPSF